VSSESKWAVALRHFSQAASYLSIERGGIQGKVKLAEALGTTGVVEERREENWWERVVGKAAGDEGVFIPGRGSGWQMKPAHGTAKPDRVIHRVPCKP
jgi:hypothetical protein